MNTLQVVFTVSLCVGGVHALFGIPNLSACAIHDSTYTEHYGCYDGASCPTNTNTTGLACSQAGQICCVGDPVCLTLICNNGTCVNDVCVCDPGYNGTNCETDWCDPGTTLCGVQTQSCNRLPEPDLYNCTCNNGFSGQHCDVDECANKGCVNGTCVQEAAPTFASCDCELGFSGELCDVDACNPNQCVNGDCVRVANGNYSCTCTPPFFGRNCNEQICDTTPCENGGTCTSNTATDYTCDCMPNYTGLTCSVEVCHANNSQCNYNGTCNPTGGGAFQCQCDLGFSGEFCELAEPACGTEPPQARLLNGNTDVVGSNPWAVRIGVGPVTYGTGVLVDRQYVLVDLLTALFASGNGATIQAYVGDFERQVTDATETLYEVTDIYPHPSAPYATFEAASAANDPPALLPNNVVVLKLNETISKGFAVNNACAPKSYDVFSCNATCRVFGFGATDSNNQAPTNFRQTLPAKLIDNDVCRFARNYTALPEAVRCGFLLDDNTGVCFGDNGGAIVCQDQGTLQWSVQGLLLTDFKGETLCSDQIFFYSDLHSLWPFVTSQIIP